MDIKKSLEEILGKGSNEVKAEVLDLIQSAKKDEEAFVKNIGAKLESYVRELADGKINQAEFKDLVSGLASLQVMEAAKLSVQGKVRAEKIIQEVKKVVLDTLMGALPKI